MGCLKDFMEQCMRSGLQGANFYKDHIRALICAAVHIRKIFPWSRQEEDAFLLRET